MSDRKRLIYFPVDKETGNDAHCREENLQLWMQRKGVGTDMRFLHISDLHIGKQLHGYNLKEDQEYCFHQITQLAAQQKPDGVLIAGDLFDRSVPAGEAYTLLDRFLEELTKAVPQALIFIIAGNHDSPERLGYASGFLRQHQIYISTMPPQSRDEHLLHVDMEDQWGTVTVWLMPFVKPGYVPYGLWPEGERSQSTEEAFRFLLEREQIDTTRRNLIVAHQLFVHSGQMPLASDSEQISLQIGGLDQVETALLSPFEYGALGHIHRPQSAGAGDACHQYRYCGTPLQYSAGEADQEKTVTLVTLKEKGSPIELEMTALKPLHPVRKLTGTLQELLEAAGDGCEDYVSIHLTDAGELFEPRQQLEEMYHRILELRIRGGYSPLSDQDEEPEQEMKNPLELFAEFYREIWGEEMSPEERRYIEEVIADETAAD